MKDNENAIIGDNLAGLRMSNRLHQVDLIAKLQVNGLDIDRSTLSAIELGRRKLLFCEIPYFAKVFNISPGELTEILLKKWLK